MAKALAKELNFVYVDTGAMYRAATLFCIKERLVEGNEIDSKIDHAVDRMYLSSTIRNGTTRGALGWSGVEEEIRSLEVAKVSLVAAIPAFAKLVELQQRMAETDVIDGRDIGTVVMPNAELKFFITADPKASCPTRGPTEGNES